MERFCSCQSQKLKGEMVNEFQPRDRLFSIRYTMRAASGYGRGFNSTPFTTLKRAVLAPIPRAMVMRATIVKPGHPAHGYDCTHRRPLTGSTGGSWA